MTTGKLEVHRSDASILLDIKNGQWDLEKLLEYAEQKTSEIMDLYHDEHLTIKCPLPKKINIPKIDKIHQEIVENYLREN